MTNRHRPGWVFPVVLVAALAVLASPAIPILSQGSTTGASRMALDADDIIPVGHFGGWMASVTVDPAGGYAYAGMGSGLAVFDISNPSAPRQVGSLPFEGYDVSTIALQGSNAVVIGGRHLSVVDLSNRSAPSVLGSVVLETELWGAKAHYVGTRAYVAAGWGNGLRIYDLSDPTQPEHVGGTTSGDAFDVHVVGTTAYVAAGTDGLLVYDVSDPDHVTSIGGYNTTGDARGLVVVGNMAYIADGFGGGLTIVDISNPTAPALVGAYVSPGRPESLAVDRDTVYLADGRDGAVIVLDISNPASPTVVTTTCADWAPMYVGLAGDVLCVGGEGHGLRLLDVSEPSSPSVLCDYSWPNMISDLYTDDPNYTTAPSSVGQSLTYLVGDGRLWVVDQSQAGASTVLGSAELDGEGAVWANGDRAYVAWSGGGQAGLDVFDVSDPTAPARVGRHAWPGSVQPKDLQVAAGVAYVADGSAGVRLVDVSDPADMQEWTAYDTPGSATRLIVVEDVAYVADGGGGLRILDVSNPASVSPVGTIAPKNGGSTSCVYVLDDEAYLGVNASGGWWVQSYDVSNPASPALINEHQPGGGGMIEDLKVYGDHIYTAVSGQSLIVLFRSNLMTVALFRTGCTHHLVIQLWGGALRIIIDMSSFGSSTYTVGQPEEPTATPQPSHTTAPTATHTPGYVFYTDTPTNSPTHTPTQTPTPTPTPIAVAAKTIDVNPKIVAPGQIVTYRLTLFWDSPDGSSASSTMQDAIPQHLEYIAGSMTANLGAPNDSNPRNLTWAGVIPDGFTVVITFRARVRCDTLMALTNTEYPSEIVNRAVGHIDGFPYAAAVSADLLKPDLKITAVEITQAIQNLANDMRLIKGKETYVRVYIKAEYLYAQSGNPVWVDGCVVPNVTARLTGPDGATLSPLNGPIAAEVLLGQDRPTMDERDQLAKCLYFRLPRNWRQQNYELIAEINPDTTRPDNYVNNNEWKKDLTFVGTKEIHLVFHMIHYNANGLERTGVQHIAELLPRFLNVYPIADENRKIYWDGDNIEVTWPVVTPNDMARVLREVAEEKSWWWDDGDTSRVGIFHQDVPLGANGGTRGFAFQPGHEVAVKQRASLSGTGITLAHEVGHNLGLAHIPCNVADGTGGAWAAARVGYPNDCWISQGTRDGYYGLDTRRPNINVRQPDEWMDMMGYGDNRWISEFSYNQLYNRVRLAAAPALFAMPGDRFLIMGTLTTTVPAGHIDSIYLSDNHTYVNNDLDGPYTLEVQNISGHVLASDSFGVNMPDPPEEAATVLGFARMLPYHATASRIVLKQGDTVLHVLQASAHAPTVTLTAPAAGTVVTDTLAVSWIATDEDGDDLTYVLLYSADDGETWRPLATYLTETSATIDARQLPGGSTCLVRVAASDGFHTAWDALDGYLVVERKPPTVSIWSPLDGDQYPTSRWVVLKGQAYDQDRAFLEGDDLAWSSDRDGVLGTGAEVEPETLSMGRHVITCTATDGMGLSASRSVTITVGYQGYLPVIVQ